MTPAVALAALQTAGVRVRLRADGRITLDAAIPPATAILDMARQYRDGIAALLLGGASDPEPSSNPPLHPGALAGERAREATPPHSPAVSLPSGVPPDWTEGVALLASLPPPETIMPTRWAAFAATSARLLHEHGAALHRDGWDAIDLFGLHAIAPVTNPTGWGLAWLLGDVGQVVDVSPEVVGVRSGPRGARLAYRRRHPTARAGTVLAWTLVPTPIDTPTARA